MNHEHDERYGKAVMAVFAGRHAGLLEFHIQSHQAGGDGPDNLEYITKMMNEYRGMSDAAFQRSGVVCRPIDCRVAELFEYGRLHAHLMEAGLDLNDIDEDLNDEVVMAMDRDEIERLLLTMQRVVTMEAPPPALMKAKAVAATLQH